MIFLKIYNDMSLYLNKVKVRYKIMYLEANSTT
jgi:hypothetical protein